MFDCLGMGLLWVVAESCNLTYGIADVRSGVGGQIQQHANYRTKVPTFSHWFSVGVAPNSNLGRWSMTPITIHHIRFFYHLLDQSWLCHGDLALVLLEIYAEVLNEIFVLGEFESFPF